MTEQRVALVLNGGVSLAVWMAGVVYEIDLLRRASGLPNPGDGPDSGLMAKWRELCGTGNGDGHKVVVDVIAGTSAGGLNGTMLATAIARGGTLNPTNTSPPWLSTLWINEASLAGDSLLSNGSGPASLLSGEYFSQTIQNRLSQLTGAGPGGPVSLFITTTTMGHSGRSYADGYGGTFTVPDHRRVYRFEHTADRLKYAHESWNPELPDTCFEIDPADDFDHSAALSLAARASASFPVAFPAVQETQELTGKNILPSNSNDHAWLLDGGILDNAPFAPVLEAMSQRPLTGDARRKLIYVVPSNGGSAQPAQINPAGPTWPQVLAASLSSPREVDFRADIDQLAGLLREDDLTWSDGDQLFSALLTDRESRAAHVAAATRLMTTYRKARAVGGIREALQITTNAGAPIALTAHAALTPVELDAILAAGPRWLPPASAGNIPLVHTSGPWQWGLTPAYNSVRLMLQWLREQLVRNPEDPQLITTVTTVDLQLRRITAVRETFVKYLAESPPCTEYVALTDQVNLAMTQIFLPEVLSVVVNEAASAFVEVPSAVSADGDPRAAVLRSALTVEVISKALHARLPQKRHASFDVLRLGPDTTAPVLDDASSTLAGTLGGDKLYGTQVFHFGAFGQEQWRKWDWLWGRLDAVAHLGRAIGRDRNMTDADITDWVTDAQTQILAAEGWTPDGIATRLEEVANLTTQGLLDAMRATPDGRLSLRLLGDRSTSLFDNLNHPALAIVSQWLRCLVQRWHPQPSPWPRNWVRWFTHPLRKASWRWLSRSLTNAPATPGLARRWPYWTGLSLLAALIAALLGLTLHWTPWIAALMASCVLFGVGITVLGLLSLLHHKRRAIGKIVPPQEDHT